RDRATPTVLRRPEERGPTAGRGRGPVRRGVPGVVQTSGDPGLGAESQAGRRVVVVRGLVHYGRGDAAWSACLPARTQATDRPITITVPIVPDTAITVAAGVFCATSPNTR